jgi:hypothetical protein
MVPLATGPIPVLIQFDSKSKRAKKPRQVKRFANGLDRGAKDFYLQMAQEGRHPVVLAADLSPVFGPHSKHTHNPTAEPAESAAPATPPQDEGALFDNTAPVSNLPD